MGFWSTSRKKAKQTKGLPPDGWIFVTNAVAGDYPEFQAGPPRASKVMTVQELTDKGMVGYYRPS